MPLASDGYSAAVLWLSASGTAKIADKRMEELGSDHYDYNFYLAKSSPLLLMQQRCSQCRHILELIQIGDTSAKELPWRSFNIKN
jgi:hypothetical protein